MYMTEEEIRRDVRLSKNPTTQVRILADINEVSPDIIRRILGGESVEVPEPGEKESLAYIVRPWSKAEIARARDMWEDGRSIKKIAGTLGRTCSSVENIARRFGFPRRKKNKKAARNGGTLQAAKANL